MTQVAKLCPRRGVTATGLCPDWGFTATWGVSVGRVRDLHGQVLLKLFSAKNEIQEEEFQARQKWLESPNGQNLVIIGQMINTGVGDRCPNTSSNKKLILRMLNGLRDYRYIRQHVFVIFNCIKPPKSYFHIFGNQASFQLNSVLVVSISRKVNV